MCEEEDPFSHILSDTKSFKILNNVGYVGMCILSLCNKFSVVYVISFV